MSYLQNVLQTLIYFCDKEAILVNNNSHNNSQYSDGHV
jgi:hypothetical protein